MPLHGVIQHTEDMVRFYESDSLDDARRKFDAHAPYQAILRITWLSRQTVFLSEMQSQVRMTRDSFIELAKVFYGDGVRFALMDRASHRKIPWGKRCTGGPLDGMWVVELELVLAGAAGDY